MAVHYTEKQGQLAHICITVSKLHLDIHLSRVALCVTVSESICNFAAQSSRYGQLCVSELMFQFCHFEGALCVTLSTTQSPCYAERDLPLEVVR
jgi:hypothetical protein